MLIIIMIVSIKEKFISVKNFPEKIDEQNNKFYKYLKKIIWKS